MNKTFLLLFAFAVNQIAFGQCIYLEPEPVFINSETVRLYVQINSIECQCPELQDADPETNPLYIWSWGPSDNRPDLNIDGQLIEVNNGNWDNSNENMRMSVDENDPFLWYYDFQNVTLPEFYGVSGNEFENGISFLLKELDGTPGTNSEEQKSADLNIQFEYSTQGTEDFDIDHETIVTGIIAPTAIAHAKDERIFVTEQQGRIRIFNRDGDLDPIPFLDIQDRVVDGGERGLLGLAFEPNFCVSGRFYVNYTNNDNGLVTRISRFEIDEDNPEQGDPDSEEILIEFSQDFSNHNGGHIEFGPDGYLYIGTGDGGAGGDPNNRAQDITSYLGKMLRIDVSPATGYDIPPDNPYILDDFGQDEIWSYGLRNPWKFAFDAETGGMYIADVGQNAFEEINYELVDAEGGLNYGWRCYEGDAYFNLNGCEGGNYVFPILDYAHSGSGASITGGRVYRGLSFESFEGWYFFTDLFSGDFGAVVQVGDETFVQQLGGIGETFVTTFGEDAWGEIYFANGNGIHRLLDPADQYVPPLEQIGNQLLSNLTGEFYEWTFNGNVLTDGSLPMIEVSENGIYEVTVFPEGESCGTTASLEVTTLNTDDQNDRKSPFKLFPNPAKDKVVIEIKEYNSKINSLNICSLDGRLLREVSVATNRTIVDVSFLAQGIYMIGLNNSEESMNRYQPLVIE